MHTLSTQQKIDILKNINWDIMIENADGICSGVYRSIKSMFLDGRFSFEAYPIINRIERMIDLLTPEDAQQFSDAGPLYYGQYWFNRNEEGYTQRKAYVDWMINEYQKRLKDEINYTTKD